MRLVFLGTGTSVGVPAIGCDCEVCRSDDPRNKRLRTSIYVESGDSHVLVDTPPDLRTQALANGISRVDYILLTHTHADHIFGFDDVRAFNIRGGGALPVYGMPESLNDMRRVFPYVLGDSDEPGRYRPRIDFVEITGPLDLGAFRVEALRVIHHPHPTVGFLIESEGKSIGYFPDASEVPDATIERLRGIDVMILDGLRDRPHFSHMTVDQSIEALGRIGAKDSYLIHMCHELDHEQTESRLPAGVRLSYDGLVLDL